MVTIFRASPIGSGWDQITINSINGLKLIVPLAFVLFGVTGTMYTVIALFKKWARKRTSVRGSQVFLMAICVSDVCALVLHSAVSLLQLLAHTRYKVAIHLCFVLCNGALSVGVFSLLLFGIDRWLPLAFPLTCKQCDSKKAKRYVLAVVCLALLLNLPLTVDFFKTSLSNEKLQLIYFLGYNCIFRLLFICVGPLMMQIFIVVHTLAIRKQALQTRNAYSYDLVTMAKKTSSTSRIVSLKEFLVINVMLLKVCLLSSLVPVIEITKVVSLINTKSIEEPHLLINVANFLVVLQCSTNWLMVHMIVFQSRNIQKDWSTTTMRRNKCSRASSMPPVELEYAGTPVRPLVLSPAQCKRLQLLWRRSIVRERSIGVELLMSLIHSNPALGWSTRSRPPTTPMTPKTTDNSFREIISEPIQEVSEKRSEIEHENDEDGIVMYSNQDRSTPMGKRKMTVESSPTSIKRSQKKVSVAVLGSGQMNFFDKIINSFDAETGQLPVEKALDIRRIGYIHFEMSVNLRSVDWQRAKSIICTRLTTEGRPEKENTDQDQQIASMFASYLIQELKCGFLCRAVSEYHDEQL